MYVARLRYIQTVHESPSRRNPDTFVHNFIPMMWKLRTAFLGKEQLSQLRSDPFYYYLVARTKYYDQVLSDAIADGVKRLVMVGCGSDTRAFRFKDAFHENGIKILECDQAEGINEKQRLASRWRSLINVEYLAIDLNDGAWPQLESWIGDAKPKTLLLMEGVSPYVNESEMGDFLRMLAARLGAGSHVAYDFKVRGVKDDFGKGGRTVKPFRLSTSRDEVAAYHAALGLHLEHMELGPALSKRLLPDLNGYSLFEEDGLLRLKVLNNRSE